MSRIEFFNEYFNIDDTLNCGQVFRFIPFNKGYKVFSCDKCAYVYTDRDKTVIECEDRDIDYFNNYFDLKRDYSKIVKEAVLTGGVLKDAALSGKGIRLLNQDKQETLFSFIISQNNNIPRIKGIIERLCRSLGEKKTFMGEEYYTFPTAKSMAGKDEEFYKSLGLGYRAEYVRRLAEEINNGLDVYAFNSLTTPLLKQKLLSLYGVGNKVCDCVALFGFKKSDSFPVDTWIEKVYRQDFKGTLKDRTKISEYFVQKFGTNSGYFQQYLFYYKREKSGE